MSHTIDNSADIIDVRDIIERVETLRILRTSGAVDLGNEEDNNTDQDTLFAELYDLEGVLAEVQDCGGDHEWEGAWYPVTLIRDSYFRDYAMELAGDIGAIDSTATWPNNCIDWDKATRELRMDYSSVEFGGVTYWYR